MSVASSEAAQAEVVAFLSHGAAYGRPDQAVERIETHAAQIFLVGGGAYKMKRAVRYSFLDFSTLERRRAVLEAELVLNRRTAPELYRRVVAVTRTVPGELALGGDGVPVEWLLEMVRFDQDALLDRVAARHGLDDGMVDRLASEVARFHAQAEVLKERGGQAAFARVTAGNAGDLRTLASGVLAPDAVGSLIARTQEALERHRNLLDTRRQQGRVRHCHGDLHLGNIVLLDGRPVLFDCLEFDLELACTDTLYDLAFLLMDLEHRRLADAATHLLSYYLELIPDDAGLALLPLFLSTRAAIRAKVNGFAAQRAHDPAAAEHERSEARAYLRLANGLIAPAPPALIAIGGLSGSGKSTLARALAPGLGAHPGAVVLRSDRLRKRLFGVEPAEHLGQDAYQESVSTRVYDAIAARATTLLRAGHSVIADAVFADPRHRRQIAAAARSASARFCPLWLDASPATLERRVADRTGDASDATVAVVRDQLRIDLSTVDWPRLEAKGRPQEVASRARRRLDL